MKLSDAIKDGQRHVVTFPHKDGPVEWPILDAGTLKRWEQMALELESENDELREAVEDIHMSILEAGWFAGEDEQWVTLHITPEQIELFEDLTE